MARAQTPKTKEGIFKILGKAFTGYFRNLNLVLPFIFMLAIIIILALAFSFTLTPSLDKIQNFQFDPTTILTVGIAVLFFLVILVSASSYIMSGVIGMASEIAVKGKTHLSTMFLTGNKAWLRFLGATLTIFVIVFIPFLIVLLAADNFVKNSSVLAQIVVLILLVLAMVLFFIFFALAPYLLVMKNLRVFASIKESFTLVKKNYVDFLLLTLIILVITIPISLIPYVGGVINILLLGPVQALVIVYFINSRK